jgi:hypothetical protein
MAEYILDMLIENAAVASAPRPTGFSNFPANTHICHFYKNKEDLLELMIPYFIEGLRNGEFCLWGVSDPLTVASAYLVLDRALDGKLASHVGKGQIEIFDVSQLYGTGVFDAMAVKDAFLLKVFESRKKGWRSFRCDGMASALAPSNWRNYQTYETEVTRSFQTSCTALCSYNLSKLSGEDVVDVVTAHQATILKKNGGWYVVESSDRSLPRSADRS